MGRGSYFEKEKNEYDMEQIMALYKPVADKLFNRIGKTAPKEDRRQIIALAFCEAAREYTASCGDIETYITKRATEILKGNNMLYVKHSRDISMDADIKKIRTSICMRRKARSTGAI